MVYDIIGMNDPWLFEEWLNPDRVLGIEENGP
jgi:hypothetical protein